ncbi:MAG TPA: Gfo/Idh/MocA family oxidoreductase [Bryobacteraceae bacterium]|jgi:predicted dehydrogenase|nr:Gfo/Idh/MocA family oxidoreductase [Bryobacteraceae bacterium]
MIRVAVVGAGQFGRNHVRVVRQSERAELAAVVDIDPARAAEAAQGLPALSDYRDLPGRVDAAIVATPTVAHAEIGCELMRAGIDVLVEKPIAPDLASADALVETARSSGRILQVGHLERYNPAVTALEKIVSRPLFFEIHRLNLFSPRGLDVDIVLDLMIHDLDIVLRMVGEARLEEIRAAGISILSEKVDIGNVRLQFAGGCVANLTASRVSTERVRKLRLFQPQEYISLDYSKQHAVKFHVGPDRQISFMELPSAKGEPLALQFESFLNSVETREQPKLDGMTARRTLEVALAILDKMRVHSEAVAQSLVTGWTP